METFASFKVGGQRVYGMVHLPDSPRPAQGFPSVLILHGYSVTAFVQQGYLTSELSHAADAGYDAAVILLDTPGGLSTSMKTIYTAELASRIPVIVYVSPEGARAASAGVWVSQAADVLAMSPTSNIGSSTPINSSGTNISSDLRRKVIHDAVASLTALAQSHHRNTIRLCGPS